MITRLNNFAQVQYLRTQRNITIQRLSLPNYTTLVGYFLLLSASSSLYETILLFRIAGLAFALHHLVFFLAVLMIIPVIRRINKRVAIFAYLFIVVEILHKLLFDLSPTIEWLKSALQFSLYLMAFVLMSGFSFSKKDLRKTAFLACFIAIFMSVFGLLQFILLNWIGFYLTIPERWRISQYRPFGDFRSLGVSRPIGLSLEPSQYALGLAVILAFVLFFESNGLLRRSKLFYLTLIVTLFSVIVTFSATGYVVSGVVLLIWTISNMRQRRINWMPYLQLALFLGASLVLIFSLDFAEPFSQRLHSVIHGEDKSTLVRVNYALKMLFATPSTSEILILGTGLGLENRELSTYYSIYDVYAIYANIRIHNIFTTIKVMQGFVGLVLYFGLVSGIISRMLKNPFSYSLIALFLLYHFATGLYFSPGFWSLLTWVAILSKFEGKS